jgi:tetratricopeptide (TPR) repeat protein
MKRHPKSVENFCYILENHLQISKDEQQTLRGLINLGFTFDDINSKESIEFLKKIVDERIILILSKNSMEKLSKAIQNEPLLSAIYVVDSSKKNSFDSKFYRGSFPDITGVCAQLENDLQILTYDLTSISSIPANFAGMSTLNYAQALKDIVLETDETRDLKKEMIDFCREEYADNVIQLELIDEFENNFQADDAIRWYLRYEAFVNKMLTRAFRVFDPDILFKLRYFIQHLHCQLKSSSNATPLTVYRTVRVKKDLVDKMKKNQGALLSFNEFLLANKNQSTIEPSLMNTNSKVVQFEIVLETGASGCDVETKPNEFLLTVGTMFRIDKVESIDEETFTAKLTTNEDITKAGELLTKDLREALRAPFPSVRMAKLMRQRELTGYTEYFCLMLLDDQQAMEDKTSTLTLGALFHSLGSFYYEKKLYDQALNHLRNALKVYLRVLPDDDVKLTPTYNNIGSIYHKQDLNEQALEYHLKAYEIQKNSKDPDMDSVAAYLGNIASVLIKLRRFKEAVSYLELDLQIKQKLHPNNDHPEVAAKYHNLAGAQYKLQQYSEALENYQKCLDIELKCHSAKNPTVAVTYYNMATALEELGQLQEAKEALEKAIARLVLTKNEDDEDLKMQRRYLKRLEDKLFMKSLFGTA